MTALGNYPYGMIVVPFSSTPTLDCSSGNMFTMTLTGNVTSITIINAQLGHMYTFLFIQDGNGLHSVTWPASFKGIVSIPITALANTACCQTVIYNGTNFYAISLGQLNL